MDNLESIPLFFIRYHVPQHQSQGGHMALEIQNEPVPRLQGSQQRHEGRQALTHHDRQVRRVPNWDSLEL